MGKTTLLRALAAAHNTEIIDLDDLETRDAVAAHPAIFVSGPAPVCIDEYQHVPLVLDAIKAELNRNSSHGFVITGSTRHDALPQAIASGHRRPDHCCRWPTTAASRGSACFVADPDDGLQ